MRARGRASGRVAGWRLRKLDPFQAAGRCTGIRRRDAVVACVSRRRIMPETLRCLVAAGRREGSSTLGRNSWGMDSTLAAQFWWIAESAGRLMARGGAVAEAELHGCGVVVEM